MKLLHLYSSAKTSIRTNGYMYYFMHARFMCHVNIEESKHEFLDINLYKDSL